MGNQNKSVRSDKDIKNLRLILFEQLNAIRAAENTEELILEKERAKAMIPLASALLDSALIELKFITKINSKATGFLPGPIEPTEETKQLPLNHEFDK